MARPTRRLHLTAARAFRSAVHKKFIIVSALHLPHRRRQVRRSVSRHRSMSTSPEETRRPKFLENSLLVIAGLLGQAPLWYQVPRWAQGLDPTFVHPRWMERSSFPLVLH